MTTHWQVLAVSVAPVRPVTKLMVAAVHAAPTRLTAGDVAALREMGYRDAADVAERISLLAARTGTILPAPASAAGVAMAISPRSRKSTETRRFARLHPRAGHRLAK